MPEFKTLKTLAALDSAADEVLDSLRRQYGESHFIKAILRHALYRQKESQLVRVFREYQERHRGENEET